MTSSTQRMLPMFRQNAHGSSLGIACEHQGVGRCNQGGELRLEKAALPDPMINSHQAVAGIFGANDVDGVLGHSNKFCSEVLHSHLLSPVFVPRKYAERGLCSPRVTKSREENKAPYSHGKLFQFISLFQRALAEISFRIRNSLHHLHDVAIEPVPAYCSADRNSNHRKSRQQHLSMELRHDAP